MNNFKKLAVAAALASATGVASADTLMISYTGTADVAIPEPYTDLYSHLDDPTFSMFSGEIIVPDFQMYQEGTYVLDSFAGDFQMSLFTPILRGLEGSQSRITVENPDYDPSAPLCESTRGCLADGTGAGRGTPAEDIVLEWNSPTMTVSERGTYTFNPADAEHGDWATLTITDGEVMDFSWGTVGADSEALAGFNARTFAGFPVYLESILVDFEGTTPYMDYDGTFYFAQNDLASAAVTLVPEPGTYAMMLAGLGLFGGMVRRRAKRQTKA